MHRVPFEVAFACLLKMGQKSPFELRIFTTDKAEGYASSQLIDSFHSQDFSSLLADQKLPNVRFQKIY